MKRLIITGVFLASLTPSFSSEAGNSQFGMITDISGKAAIQRQSNNVKISFGSGVLQDDKIVLDKDAKIVMVAYENCSEWNISGPGDITINKVPTGSNLSVVSSRKLPICYVPGDFHGTDSKTMGGLQLRGGTFITNLRNEFKKGNSSNSDLLTIILYDLKKGNKEKAKPYFEKLKKRVPQDQLCTITGLSALNDCDKVISTKK
jgi:hypothetical protein